MNVIKTMDNQDGLKERLKLLIEERGHHKGLYLKR